MTLPNQLELQKNFSAFLFEAGLSAVSVKNYLSDLRHFLSFCASLSLNQEPPTVQEVFQSISKYVKLYIADQEKGFTPQSTINRRMASIRRFTTFLQVKFGLTSSSPDIQPAPKSTEQDLPTLSKILIHFKQYLEKEKKTHSTIKNYISDLNHFFAWSANETPFLDQKLETILSASHLNSYVTYLKLSHIGTSVINRRQSSVKQFTRYCFLQKYIPTNPFEYKQVVPGLVPLAWIERLRHRNSHAPKNASTNRLAILYQKYNALPFTPYLHLAILALATSAMVIFGYNQIIKQARPSSAALPTVPRRQLSFQGRLTDSSGTPITTSVNVVFKLFNALTSGTQLYTSNTCAIVPDPNGIFNTLIGNGTCGAEIASTVFTENRDVFLEITVGAETLTPRQQIATVGYALNSETLQGYPASTSATPNTVPIVDANGDITIAATSPNINSTSGTFTLSGQALTLSTAANSGGNIVLQPDSIGGGQVQVLGGTTTSDTLRIENANLTSGALISGYVGNNTATGRLLSLTAGSTETDRFYVAASGQTLVNGATNLTNSALIVNQAGAGGLFTASTSGVTKFTIANNGDVNITGALKDNGDAGTSGQILSSTGTGVAWIAAPTGGSSLWQLNAGAVTPLNITNSLNLGATATASATVHLAGTSGENSFINTGYLGIGTTNPSVSLHVAGTTTNNYIQADIGINLKQVVVDNTSGMSVAVQNVAGNINTGNHYYTYTYVTDLGETDTARPIIGPYTFDATHGQAIVTVPISTDYRVIKRRIYRGKAGQAIDNQFLVGEIADNSTSTFTDNVADSSLGTLNSYRRPNTTNNMIRVNGSTAMILDTYNTSFGLSAGAVVMANGGYSNAFFGKSSGGKVTTGYGNTLLGEGAGPNIVGGNYSTMVGATAGYNWTGSSNTLVGAYAGYAGSSNVTGTNNVLLGYGTAYSSPTGAWANNTLLGTSAGKNLAGSNNVFVGYNAGFYETGSSKLFIDNQARTDEATARTNSMIYGVFDSTVANQSLTVNAGTIYLNGNVGIGLTNPAYALDVTGDINLTGALRASGAPGSSGQVLSSTGTGVQWIPAPTGGSSLWQLNAGALTPLNITNSVNIGATATASALVHLAGTANENSFVNTGNFGVGLTNPTGKLQVTYTGADSTTVPFVVDSSASSISTYPAFKVILPATGSRKGFQLINSTDVNAWASFEYEAGGTNKPGLALGPGGATGRDVNIYRDAADVLKTDDTLIVGGALQQTGSSSNYFTSNVGFGVTNPAAQVNISGSTSSQLRITNPATGGGYWNIAQTDNNMGIGGGKLMFLADSTTSSNAKVVFTNTGNVGIGVTSPTYKLDVAGDINLTGALRASGAAGTSGQILSSTGAAVAWIDAPANYWQLNAGALTPLNITNSINLGATATASALVHLAGTAGENSWINTGNFGVGTTSPTQTFDVSNFFVVDTANSRVGIGITNPSSALEIAGASSLISNTTGDIAIDSASGLIDFSGDSLVNFLNATASGQVKLASFADASRPVPIGAGAIIYSTTQGNPQYYDGSAWKDFSSGAVAGNSSPWDRSAGVIHPFTLADSVNLGAVATASANVHLGGKSGDSSFFIDPTAFGFSSALSQPRVGYTFRIQTDGGILPKTDATDRLGYSANQWKELYLSNDIVKGSTAVITLGNYSLTGAVWHADQGFKVGDTLGLGSGMKFEVTGNASVSGTFDTGGQLVVAGGAGKLDAGTVDPPYTINGNKYATYMASMVGIKEETVGKVTTSEDNYISGLGYRTLIDLDQQPVGSDIWLFSQTTNIQEHINDLSVLLTPEGQAKAWYEVDRTNKILAIYSSTPTNITYRLTAPRFDSDKWQNTRATSEKSIGHVINDNNLYSNTDSIFDNPTIDPELIAKLDGSFALKINGQDNREVSSFVTSIIANLKAGVAVVSNLVADNLTVRTKLISPIADIDQLKTIDATVSGTLYADNIKGQTVDALHSQIDLLDQKYSTASAILADLQAKYGNYSSLLGAYSEATDSGDPLTLSPLATTSAIIPSDLALNSLNVQTLFGNDILADGSIFTNSLSAFDTDLFIQPAGDKPVHLLANLMTLYPDGKVLINGDVLVTGTIYAQAIDTKDASVSGTLAVGSSTIATESANFAQLTTGGLIIASGKEATDASSISQTNSNATIGTAVIATGSSEIAILNTKVTPTTLIYVTPTSDTQGGVLYVKSKQAGVGFIVALSGFNSNTDISFNYWLVETR